MEEKNQYITRLSSSSKRINPMRRLLVQTTYIFARGFRAVENAACVWGEGRGIEESGVVCGVKYIQVIA